MKHLIIIFHLLTVITIFPINKILFVNSYHKGYEWSDSVEKGFLKKINNKNIQVRFFRLDSKRFPEEDKIKQNVDKANSLIKSFKPDIIIASDDNASKYLVMPYLKNINTPVIFCGINWDASIYGYPYKNSTGMISVTPINLLLKYLKNYKKGTKIAYLASPILSSEKDIEFINKFLKLKINVFYIKDIEELKHKIESIQKDNEILILGNISSIKNYNKNKIAKIIEDNIKIPIGTTFEFQSNFALISFTNVAEEQGEWAAQTALKVLDGAKINHIKITQNKRGKLFLNLKIAKKLNISIPDAHIKSAHYIIK